MVEEINFILKSSLLTIIIFRFWILSIFYFPHIIKDVLVYFFKNDLVFCNSLLSFLFWLFGFRVEWVENFIFRFVTHFPLIIHIILVGLFKSFALWVFPRSACIVEQTDTGWNFCLHLWHHEAHIICKWVNKDGSRDYRCLHCHIIGLHLYQPLLLIIFLRSLYFSLYLIYQLEHIMLTYKILVTKIKDIETKFEESWHEDCLTWRNLDRNRLDQWIEQYFDVSCEVKHAYTLNMTF